MNNEMAYLLGMICGNGTIRRGNNETNISIEIPHKKQLTESGQDVLIYVKASIADIINILTPLIGTDINFSQAKSVTALSFSKRNEDLLIRELLRLVGNFVSHENIRIHQEVFNYSDDMKKQFLRGFADVTGYITRSGAYIIAYMHRVYLEVPHNWHLVVDICNLLKTINIPVQNIDWAHPNMRDGNLRKYNEGYVNFWKKEHQVKIFANEFLPISFSVEHKREALHHLSDELKEGLLNAGKNIEKTTHKFYWDKRENNRIKRHHPAETDISIPSNIRGNHYNSWKDIAKDLGYIK
ncbi:MAG: hypothetical protein LBT79_02060 [Elusimicrobiota bacterium]|jgi:hypothetical protein|nr:hypothetical protein [Elusimicrobiota bacterium]